MSDNATIRRAKHDGDNPYFLMRRDTAQDHGISAEALGVLTEVLSRPDNWQVRVSQLTGREGLGRDKAYRILNELIEARYVERIQCRDAHGRVTSVEYVVHESQLPENPDTVKPDTENTHITYKKEGQNTEVTKNTVADKTPATARPSNLTNDQRERLQADGTAIAERVAAMERVTPDDFTSSADGMTNADTRAQPFETLKDAVTAVWGWDNGGLITNMAKMLAGKRGKGEYDTYKFDSQPVTADELEAWAAWVKQTYPKRDMVTTCESIAKSVGEYRAAAINTPQRAAPIIPADDVLRRQVEERVALNRRNTNSGAF